MPSSSRGLPSWVPRNIREAEDPIVSVILLALAALTLVLLILGPVVTDSRPSAFRDATLKGAGAGLLLLGSYFAARTLKQTRADQRAGRVLQAIQMLENKSPEVRIGAVWALVGLAVSSEGPRERADANVIWEVVQQLRTDFPEAWEKVESRPWTG